MKSDIEIAHSVKLKPIADIVRECGIEDMDLVLPNGNYKAKLSLRLFDQLPKEPRGKLVLEVATRGQDPERPEVSGPARRVLARRVRRVEVL